MIQGMLLQWKDTTFIHPYRLIF